MRKSAPLFCALLLSLSARRAWIEISFLSKTLDIVCVALRKESVDRNLLVGGRFPYHLQSLSARRAWIEIGVVIYTLICRLVALRKESVDRNNQFTRQFGVCGLVALRKESVDRNIAQITDSKTRIVALRKESVDRNMKFLAPIRN